MIYKVGCRVSLGMLGGGLMLGVFVLLAKKKARERYEEIFGRVPPFFG